MISLKKIFIIGTIIVVTIISICVALVLTTKNTEWVSIVAIPSIALISAAASVISGYAAYGTLIRGFRPAINFTIKGAGHLDGLTDILYMGPDYYLFIENKGNNEAQDIEIIVTMLLGTKDENDKVDVEQSEKLKLPNIPRLFPNNERMVLHLRTAFPKFYEETNKITIRQVIVMYSYKNMLGQATGEVVTFNTG